MIGVVVLISIFALVAGGTWGFILGVMHGRRSGQAAVDADRTAAAREVLQLYLLPDSMLDAESTIEELLEIFDNRMDDDVCIEGDDYGR